MNLIKKTACISLLCTALFSTGAMAQYTGPGATPQPTTAAEALKARDDTPVVLEGYIIRKLGNEKYEFRDSSGTIRVEIDDKDWPAGNPVSDKTKVRITGEVDKGRRSTEVDVDIVEIIR